MSKTQNYIKIQFRIRGYLALWFCLPFVGFRVTGQVSAPKYSNEFMFLGVGAQQQGMGNTGVVTTDNAFSGYWNPAGLTGLSKKYDGGLMHTSWMNGLARYQFATIATQIDSQTVFGASFLRFGVDKIADTRFLVQGDVIDYSQIRQFNSSDNALILSLSRKRFLGIDQLSFGANAKILYRQAGNFGSAWGFGFDIGAKYQICEWALGANFRDITTTFNAWSFNRTLLEDAWLKTGNTLPSNSIELTLPRLSIGIARNFYWLNKALCLTPVIDLDLTFDGKRNAFLGTSAFSADPKLGLQLGYKGIAFLRGGISRFQTLTNYKGDKTTDIQPSMGVGFRHKGLRVDYALTDPSITGSPQLTHIISLGYAWD